MIIELQFVVEIERDYRAVTCPSIDVIRHGDFSYVSVDPYKRGTFNWRFDYKERIITAEQSIARRSEADPVKYVFLINPSPSNKHLT